MRYPTIEEGGKRYKNVYGFYFHHETNDKVIDLLVNAYTGGSRIRLYYGDVKTGKCWMDEYDMSGTIGRSTGRIKIPLIINNSRSLGGPGLLEHCIIGVQYKNAWLYRQDNFHLAEITLEPSKLPGYTTAVLFDGELRANFKSLSKAERYAAFMKGERGSK